jgi:hypothetical protein
MTLTLAKLALVQRGQDWAEDLPDSTIKVIGTLESWRQGRLPAVATDRPARSRATR